jgi:hypothetical protein
MFLRKVGRPIFQQVHMALKPNINIFTAVRRSNRSNNLLLIYNVNPLHVGKFGKAACDRNPSVGNTGTPNYFTCLFVPAMDGVGINK